MRTKICGITSYEDAMMAIDAGADAKKRCHPRKPRHVQANPGKNPARQRSNDHRQNVVACRCSLILTLSTAFST